MTKEEMVEIIKLLAEQNVINKTNATGMIDSIDREGYRDTLESLLSELQDVCTAGRLE